MSGFAVAAEVKVRDTEGDEVVVYPVIAEPLIAPAVYGIETVVALVPATVPIVGEPGADGGSVLKLGDVLDCGEVPTLLVAVTLNL